MKKSTLAFILLLSIISVNAQEKTGKWRLGLYGDLARTEFVKRGERGILEGYQAGLETNYQFTKRIGFSGGLEHWSATCAFGIIAGARYYPHKNFFIRARRVFLINRSAIGAGWQKSIGKSLNLELMADYYFKESLAARAGISYTLPL